MPRSFFAFSLSLFFARFTVGSICVRAFERGRQASISQADLKPVSWLVALSHLIAIPPAHKETVLVDDIAARIAPQDAAIVLKLGEALQSLNSV